MDVTHPLSSNVIRFFTLSLRFIVKCNVFFNHLATISFYRNRTVTLDPYFLAQKQAAFCVKIPQKSCQNPTTLMAIFFENQKKISDILFYIRLETVKNTNIGRYTSVSLI